MTSRHRALFGPLLLSLGCLCYAVSPLWAADRLVTGQWEFTVTTDGASHTSKHCVTAEEAAGVNGTVATARAHSEEKAARGHCSVKSFDIQGDTVTYSLTCGTRRIDSTTTFHGDSSEGSLTTTHEGKSVVTQVKAQRLGLCQ